MMSGNILGQSMRLILCLLILGFSSTSLLSQKSLSGNINQPKTHVVTIGADRVTVNNVTGFSVNDTILLIQMQGVRILTALNVYGTLQNKTGEPGMHEFMIILSINGGTNEIVFRNNILNSYDPAGNVQIVRVPYYNSAKVTSKLFCTPWDTVTKSGGVLALIIGRTLTLDADIDVSALGFKGGKDTVGDGICRNTNQVLYGQEYYNRGFRNAGFKGEGVANLTDLNQPLGKSYMKGLGSNWTGGGGGNGRYSGGGGGSNRGAGGLGGLEDCFPNFPGGNGGIKADHPSLPDRIYMGGGGGASTASPGGSSSNGGNGGGIVIIVADGIVGNGGNILSDGGSGGSAVGVGGSGGGGAGGSISLSLNSYGSTSLKFSLLGGNGGDDFGGYGEGGGGGGGLLYVSTNTTGNVTNNLSGGTSSVSSGGTGEKRLGFKAILNGFLFNTISSSVTDNQVDSVCSNMSLKKIIGTKPVGGTGPYTYLWEKSYDQVTWIPLTNDTDPTNYTPTLIETTTVWFRRTITDSSVPTILVDVSKPVRIIVHPFIKNNIVGTSDTICFAQDPPAFTSKAILLDGNGKYSFNWKISLNNSLFTIPVNSHNAEGYTPPPALLVTSWYKRFVTSGRCIDSTATVKITVLDTIRNNRVLNSPPDICYGMTFNNLSATTSATTPALAGGDNAYIFKWESNINGGGWGTAPGVSNVAGYNPIELAQRVPSNQYIFRRVVYSGIHNVCSSTSNAVLLKDFPQITNNTVAPVPVICSGIAPGKLIGSKTPTLSGGNTIYTYSWQDSTITHTWANIAGETNPDYQPPILTETTRYRRIVNSSACADVSKSIGIVVHQPILNNNISVSGGGVAETICNNQQPGILQGTLPSGGTGSYTFQWKFSLDNSVFTAIPIAGNGTNYSPPQLTNTTYYKREVTSGACVASNNLITETVLPLITNNTISGNPKVCFSRVPDIITGATLSGGSGIYKYFWWQSTDGGVNWVAASGTNNSPTYQPPALTVGIKYQRTVTSGLNDCCTSTSNVFDIGIDPLPLSAVYAGPDTTIFSFEKIYHMKAAVPVTGETGEWTTIIGGGKADNNLNNTVVRNLSVGKNSFLWTLTKGNCALDTSVVITLIEDFIPQGFSPNGDAWNNTFVIEGLNLTDQFVDLSIINGAGTEVFSASNHNGQTLTDSWTDWDGRNSKGLDLPEGTYYYMLKITPKTSGKALPPKSGFIVLKRY
jgi:CHU_C Type IX secretion signal domain